MIDEKYEEIKNQVSEYMLLADPGILRLLLAFCVGNRLPLPPSWIFLVSSSSGGKTKLIQLLELVKGYFEIDDLTANTLLSGMKRHDGETSLLKRMPKDGFIVFKDFTTILSKYKEQMAVLMGQLRMVYDGKLVKHTGQGDSLSWNPAKAPGLIAGVTTKIYTTTQDWADMGERMIMYHMKQPSNLDVGRWIIGQRRDEKILESKIKKSIAEFINSIQYPSKPEDLPVMDKETSESLVQIAFLTVQSRSPVERTQTGYKRRMNLKHDNEMIGRFLKQLINLSYALMLMSPDRKLSDADRAILYKIGLDSIPLQRHMVMVALTQNKLGGDLPQLSEYLKYPQETVEEWVEDLVALGIINSTVQLYGSIGRKRLYHMAPEYAEIMARFERLNPAEVALPKSLEDTEAEMFMEG